MTAATPTLPASKRALKKWHVSSKATSTVSNAIANDFLLATRYSLLATIFPSTDAESNSRHHCRSFSRDVSRETEDGIAPRRRGAAPDDPRRHGQPAGPRAHGILQIFCQQTHSGPRRGGDDLPESDAAAEPDQDFLPD